MNFGELKPMANHAITAPEILQAGLDAMKQRAVIRDAPGGERSAGRAAGILTAWTGRQWVEEDV